MNDETQFKQLVVDAIMGIGFPSVVMAQECERVGLAQFSGDQWNPDWQWIRTRVEAIELDKLQELYEGLSQAREDNRKAHEAAPEPSLIVLQ